MGLDMYLSAEKYVGAWDDDTASKSTYETILEALGVGYFIEKRPYFG